MNGRRSPELDVKLRYSMASGAALEAFPTAADA
jgi:hypothetical protein